MSINCIANVSFAGLSGALVLSIALVVLGYFIKTVNLGLRGAIIMFTVAIAGTVASLTGMLFWECDQPQLAGSLDVQTYELVKQFIQPLHSL